MLTVSSIISNMNSNNNNNNDKSGIMISNNKDIDKIKDENLFGYGIASSLDTRITDKDILFMFKNNSIIRINMLYHNTKNFIIDRNIFRNEVISVGIMKIIHKNIINDNSIYIGCRFLLHNVNKYFYISDIIEVNNINYNVVKDISLESELIFSVPNIIMYNIKNKYGVGLNDFIIIPRNDNNISNILYNNVNDMNYIYNNISITYYGISLNNTMSRNNSVVINNLNTIFNKYIKDIHIHNNSSKTI